MKGYEKGQKVRKAMNKKIGTPMQGNGSNTRGSE